MAIRWFGLCVECEEFGNVKRYNGNNYCLSCYSDTHE